MVGGAVLDSFDAGSGSTVWSLLVSPSGSVEVERKTGFAQGAYAFDSASLSEAESHRVRRNLLPDANGAAIARIWVETLVCDNPAPGPGGTDDVTLKERQSPAHAGARKPSIAEHQGERCGGVRLDREIFVATREAPFD